MTFTVNSLIFQLPGREAAEKESIFKRVQRLRSARAPISSTTDSDIDIYCKTCTISLIFQLPGREAAEKESIFKRVQRLRSARAPISSTTDSDSDVPTKGDSSGLLI